MSLISLPSIAEEAFKDYLSANFTGTYQKIIPESGATEDASYSFVRSFSLDPLTYPAVIVKVGQLKELEPATHVYNASLSVMVWTQVDTADPIATHLSAAGQVYDLLADGGGMTASLNAREDFKLWNIYSTNYDQEFRDDDVMTVLDYAISIQSLGL